jgi:hypothetical protein
MLAFFLLLRACSFSPLFPPDSFQEIKYSTTFQGGINPGVHSELTEEPLTGKAQRVNARGSSCCGFREATGALLAIVHPVHPDGMPSRSLGWAGDATTPGPVASSRPREGLPGLAAAAADPFHLDRSTPIHRAVRITIKSTTRNGTALPLRACRRRFQYDEWLQVAPVTRGLQPRAIPTVAFLFPPFLFKGQGGLRLSTILL